VDLSAESASEIHDHRKVKLAELVAMPRPEEIDVVTHGDLTPDNVLVDTHTAAVTAVLDAGRLGVTGAWRDLALARRDLRELDPRLSARFLARYGTAPDPGRDGFYRLLDEFL
jgi:aminoglycoside phosphotransferase